MSAIAVEVGEEGVDAVSHADIPGRRLWNHPEYLHVRGRTLVVRACRGDRVVGFWLVPIEETPEGVVACRPCRLFPYCAPEVFEEDGLRRRQTVTALFSALQSRVILINLPMAPGFRDANAAIAVGCFAEWRHTHIISRERWVRLGEHFSPTAKAHARRAAKRVRILPYRQSARFLFDRAIRGSQWSVQWRRSLGDALVASGQAIILEAEAGDSIVGSALIAYDDHSAYFYHMWFDRDGPSGVPSLLIRESLRWVFEHTDATLFDFEGSILASVDTFMTGFGARIEPYSHIYWSPDRNRLMAAISESLDIEGRVMKSA